MHNPAHYGLAIKPLQLQSFLINCCLLFVAAKLMGFFNESGKKVKRNQMYAMLYKKMLNQAPKMIPIMMLLVVLLAIIFLSQITKILCITIHEFTELSLGVPDYTSSRQDFDRYLNCTFVEAIRPPYRKLQRIDKYSFTNKRMVCGEEDYINYLNRDENVYDRLGAASYNPKSNTFTVWMNRRLFHSAIVSINLAHNLMLG